MPPATSDAIVIGSGVIGASVAYELGRRGATVRVGQFWLLLDR